MKTEDSPAKKVCHPTKPKWVAHPGMKGSMNQPPQDPINKSPSSGLEAPRRSPPGRGRRPAVSNKPEVTHTEYSKKTKVKVSRDEGKLMKNITPQSGDSNSRSTNKKKQVNSGFTLSNKLITQFFTTAENVEDLEV